MSSKEFKRIQDTSYETVALNTAFQRTGTMLQSVLKAVLMAGASGHPEHVKIRRVHAWHLPAKVAHSSVHPGPCDILMNWLSLIEHFPSSVSLSHFSWDSKTRRWLSLSAFIKFTTSWGNFLGTGGCQETWPYPTTRAPSIGLRLFIVAWRNKVRVLPQFSPVNSLGKRFNHINQIIMFEWFNYVNLIIMFERCWNRFVCMFFVAHSIRVLPAHLPWLFDLKFVVEDPWDMPQLQLC